MHRVQPKVVLLEQIQEQGLDVVTHLLFQASVHGLEVLLL